MPTTTEAPTKRKPASPPAPPPARPRSITAALEERRLRKRDAARKLWGLAQREAAGTPADGDEVVTLLEAAGLVDGGEPDAALWTDWVHRAARIPELKKLAADLPRVEAKIEALRQVVLDARVARLAALKSAGELRASIGSRIASEGLRGSEATDRRVQLITEIGRLEGEAATQEARGDAARKAFRAYVSGEAQTARAAAAELAEITPPMAR